MDQGLGDVLRRRRRLRHNGWRLRVRQPLLDGVRDEHGGVELVAVQRRGGVRGVLPGDVRPAEQPVVPAGRDGDRDGDQPVPAGLVQGQQQRRLVQPAAAALRHGAAGLGEDRRLPRRVRPGHVPEGVMLPERRGAVHHQRQQLLRAGPHHQRRRPGVAQVGADQGHPDRVDHHVQELGRQLAGQQLPQRPEHLLPRHRHQRPDHRVLGGRGVRMAVRPDLHQRPEFLLAAAIRPASHACRPPPALALFFPSFLHLETCQKEAGLI